MLGVLLSSVLPLLLDVACDRLGSVSWEERQAAGAEVRWWGEIAVPVLRRRTGDPDWEVRRRAERLLDDWRESVWAGRGSMPWLDMLGKDFPDRQAAIDRWLAEAKVVVAPCVRDWPEYRHATALFVRHLLESGWSVAKARGLLERMAENERQWRRGRGM